LRLRAAIALIGNGRPLQAVLREPILTWGATNAQAAATLPGDDLLVDADGVATRAILIAASPAAVWPWVAQMGPRRVAVPTPTTGSRTSSVWTCTASTKCCPNFNTLGLATQLVMGPIECASSVWSRIMLSPGAPRMATGCGRSSSSPATARRSCARLRMVPMELASLVMEQRCCAESSSARSGCTYRTERHGEGTGTPSLAHNDGTRVGGSSDPCPAWVARDRGVVHAWAKV
jgi:hypothetical protein